MVGWKNYTAEKHLGVETHCIGFNSLSTCHICAYCDAFLIFKIPKRAFREYFLLKMTIVFVWILDSCSHFSHEWWTKPQLLLVHHIAVDTPKEHPFPHKRILLFLQGWLFISSPQSKIFSLLMLMKNHNKRVGFRQIARGLITWENIHLDIFWSVLSTWILWKLCIKIDYFSAEPEYLPKTSKKQQICLKVLHQKLLRKN